MRRNEGDYEQLKMVREHPVPSSTTCLRIKTSCPTGAAVFLLPDYERFDVIAGSRLLILSVSLTNVRSFQISRRCIVPVPENAAKSELQKAGETRTHFIGRISNCTLCFFHKKNRGVIFLWIIFKLR